MNCDSKYLCQNTCISQQWYGEVSQLIGSGDYTDLLWGNDKNQ